MEILYCAVIGYLLGCLNFGYLIGRMHGIDIREQGSGNAGASNAVITLGKRAGVITGILDILKGFLAVFVCRRFFTTPYAPYIGGVSAVIGHIFPFYMHFRGGKGFASYIGMTLALNWHLGLAIMAMTIVVTLVTDYISLATLATSLIVPVWLYLNGAELTVLGMYAVLAGIIFWKHRINLQRIRNHEEIGFWSTARKKKESV